MTIVNDILKQIPGLGQSQRKFLGTLFVTILVLRGRVNFRNLSRYCDYAERTIARQFRKPFDWPDFHQRVLMTALDPHSELISAHDASFISNRRYAEVESRINKGIDSRLGGETLCLSHYGYTSWPCCILPT